MNIINVLVKNIKSISKLYLYNILQYVSFVHLIEINEQLGMQREKYC